MLADPEGSALYGWVKSNDLTVAGQLDHRGHRPGRVPENLEGAPIDDAVRIPDAEALEQIFDLLIHEGLSVGGSTGINVAAAIRVAQDAGTRATRSSPSCAMAAHAMQSKLFNPEFLRVKNLPVPGWLAEHRSRQGGRRRRLPKRRVEAAMTIFDQL